MIDREIFLKCIFTGYKKIILAIFIGLSMAFLIFNFTDRVYESHFEIGLGKIEGAGLRGINSDVFNTSIPFILDAQRSLLNPENISVEMLQNCGLSDSNFNRKKLVSNIFVSRIYSDTALSYKIHVNSPEFQKSCALYIANYQLVNFNGRLNQVLDEIAPIDILQLPEVKIIRPKIIRPINYSDSFISPNFFKILIGTEFLFVFLTLFYLYKRNTNV